MSGAGIVHLGLGAFFRAHVARYVSEAMAAEGGDWRVIGVSLRRPDVRDALAPRGFRYHAVELRPDGEIPREIDVIKDVLVAPEDPEAVIRAMSDPGVRLVTLTVTEKGYCRDPATGALDRTNPDIAADIADPDRPRSAPGFLVAALARRRALGLRPFTILSCDNLPDNGAQTRAVTLALARETDAALADWIEAEARFPSTMVDRIVPATTPEDVARLARDCGITDAAPVFHEPFRQWVIEDDFVDGIRPAFEAAGATMVADVAPFEAMKLRCLNGAHTALACLGLLAGHETIADTVADPPFAAYVRHLWRVEIVPAVTPPPGVDLGAYTDALFDRFANPAIRHRTAQIATDTSQKLPQRLLATLADNRAAGRPYEAIALAVAAWFRLIEGTDDTGRPVTLDDPLLARLKALSDDARGPAGKVAALLSLAEVFPAPLARDAALRDCLAEQYEALRDRGTRARAGEYAS